MIEYKLTRSKRKSVAVCVTADGVTVKAPLKMPSDAINGFVSQKEKWIVKKLGELRLRQSKYACYINCDKFILFGSELAASAADGRFNIKDGTLFIPKKFCCNGNYAVTAEFKKALKRYYNKLAAAELAARLNRYSQAYKLPYSSFSLTNAKTKWGSCDGRNGIRLNWRLILLPSSVCDYVIIHELAHTLHHNHSRAFWNCVGNMYLKYKEAAAWLKEAGVLMDFLR